MDATEERVKKVTHLQFMQAVDCLRKHKQEFLDRRPDHAETGKMLAEKLGFPINRGTTANIREAAGVVWESRRKTRNGKAAYHAYNSVATLTRSLHLLFKKLDEEPPAGLQSLHDYFARKDIDAWAV